MKNRQPTGFIFDNWDPTLDTTAIAGLVQLAGAVIARRAVADANRKILRALDAAMRRQFPGTDLAFRPIAPGAAAFRFGDGTVISLADWLDDRLFGPTTLPAAAAAAPKRRQRVRA